MGEDDTHNLTRAYESFFWIALTCSDTYLVVWETQYSKEPVLTFGEKKKKIKSIPGRINFI